MSMLGYHQLARRMKLRMAGYDELRSCDLNRTKWKRFSLNLMVYSYSSVQL